MQVDGNGPFKIGIPKLAERSADADAGGVHQHVDCSQRTECRITYALRHRRTGEVENAIFGARRARPQAFPNRHVEFLARAFGDQN